MALKETLVAHLEQFHTAPFLFVGSGLSRRYLGLEDWDGLLRRFASLTARPYEYFRSSADGKHPRIASEIAKELHILWWSSENFSNSREKYISEAIKNQSALKIEISRYLEVVSTTRVSSTELLQELDMLGRATVDGIITTNWDLLLEDSFPDYEVYVGQDELLFSASQGIGEIYKIHGCCSKPNSLVATEEDYDRFNRRNPYLAAKLLTVFAEHPVLFLGYSLNDPNISALLQSIALCLTTENINQLRDRLIFVRWDPNEEYYQWQDNSIVTLGFPIPVKTISSATFTPIFEALLSLPRKFPAKVLRRLKEHVYELVHDNDPADRLHVMDIDEDTDVSEIKVVYGVGLKIEKEATEVRLSSDPSAQPVRLTDDPDAPVLPYSLVSPDSEYASTQEELEALVRTWRNDNYAYVARSRLRAFYASRVELKPTKEALKCLIISAMCHHAPTHYWARELGRDALIDLVREEVILDHFLRVKEGTKLAFAIGMSDGEEILLDIGKRSKHRTVRQLAERLHRQLLKSSTIHSEYRSPTRSFHRVDNKDITIDIATLFDNTEDVEIVLSYLANQTDQKSLSRLKQLDAYFYGTRIR
jgi:hypothetical protein